MTRWSATALGRGSGHAAHQTGAPADNPLQQQLRCDREWVRCTAQAHNTIMVEHPRGAGSLSLGVSIFLLVVGAVLTFAVDVTTSGFSIHTVGIGVRQTFWQGFGADP
jgi:hypothetical protein